MCPVVVRNSKDEATWEGGVAWHTFITNHLPNPLPARKWAEKQRWGDTPQSPLAEGLRPSALPPLSLRGACDEAIWGGGVGQALSFSNHQSPCRCEERATKQSGEEGSPGVVFNTTNPPVVARSVRGSNLGRRGRPNVVFSNHQSPCHSEPAYRRQAERRIHLQTHDSMPIRPPQQIPPHNPFVRQFTPKRAC